MARIRHHQTVNFVVDNINFIHDSNTFPNLIILSNEAIHILTKLKIINCHPREGMANPHGFQEVITSQFKNAPKMAAKASNSENLVNVTCMMVLANR
jgi:hypothetical protein